jgi:chorismate--pyruvate lyase
MKLEQLLPWDYFESIESQIKNDEIKSWLQEVGPITKRIKSNKEFKLELIQDELDIVKASEREFLKTNSNDIRVREVILYANQDPFVFARTIIPTSTIQKGLSDLGKIGNKPLGDILFEKEIFSKEIVLCSSFKRKNKIFWGRISKYTVKGYPFSVMEVFLINDN